MEKTLTIIAVVAIFIMGGVWLVENHGLTADVDFSSPQAVALAYLKAYQGSISAGFFNRQDRRAYDLLAPETKENVDSQSGPLFNRLISLANGFLPPADLSVAKIESGGDQARVYFNALTIYLVERNNEWQVYSIIPNHE